MNNIEQVQVNYIRPNRTIETILLTDVNNADRKKIVYIYNYEGYHFRIFENIFEISNFINDEEYKVLKEYSTDRGVDNFLFRYYFDF